MAAHEHNKETTSRFASTPGSIKLHPGHHYCLVAPSGTELTASLRVLLLCGVRSIYAHDFRCAVIIRPPICWPSVTLWVNAVSVSRI